MIIDTDGTCETLGALSRVVDIARLPPLLLVTPGEGGPFKLPLEGRLSDPERSECRLRYLCGELEDTLSSGGELLPYNRDLEDPRGSEARDSELLLDDVELSGSVTMCLSMRRGSTGNE